MISRPSDGPAGSLALIAVSRAGVELANRLYRAWPDAEYCVLERYRDGADSGARAVPAPLGPLVAELFGRCRGLVVFLPIGAVVRLVAPCLGDKRSDPAVVAVDDTGRFAVSLLSGHLGGADDLAGEVAQLLGAQPVITAASEARGLPAPELIGRPYGWLLQAEREPLLRVAAALVNLEPLAIYQDDGERDWRPAGLEVKVYEDLERLAANAPPAALVITDRRLPHGLGERAVVWRPRRLVIGAGCSSGAPPDELWGLLQASLEAVGLAAAGVGRLATLDRKLAEPAIRELGRRLGLQPRGYSAAELATVAVPNPSAVVLAAVGTPSVAEAAARLAADGGDLLAAKRTSAHGTVAIARRSWRASEGTGGR